MFLRDQNQEDRERAVTHKGANQHNPLIAESTKKPRLVFAFARNKSAGEYIFPVLLNFFCVSAGYRYGN